MTANEQYKELVEFIRKESDAKYSIKNLAHYFGCSAQSLSNKFFRGSFSIADIMLLLYLHSYKIKLTANGETVKEYDPRTFVIDNDVLRNNVKKRNTEISQEIDSLSGQMIIL